MSNVIQIEDSEKQPLNQKKASEIKAGSFSDLFFFASRTDKVVMVIATILSLG